MSNKATCPGCDAHLSSIWMADEDGEPCPNCGLSHTAREEVRNARRRSADAELKEKYAEAVMRADRAEREARALRARLQRVKTALDVPDADIEEWEG